MKIKMLKTMSGSANNIGSVSMEYTAGQDYMMTADSVAEMLEWIVGLNNQVQVRSLSFDVGNYNG